MGPGLIQEGGKPSCLWGPGPPTQEVPWCWMLRIKRNAPGTWYACRGPWAPHTSGHKGSQGQPADTGTGDQETTQHLENQDGLCGTLVTHLSSHKYLRSGCCVPRHCPHHWNPYFTEGKEGQGGRSDSGRATGYLAQGFPEVTEKGHRGWRSKC